MNTEVTCLMPSLEGPFPFLEQEAFQSGRRLINNMCWATGDVNNFPFCSTSSLLTFTLLKTDTWRCGFDGWTGIISIWFCWEAVCLCTELRIRDPTLRFCFLFQSWTFLLLHLITGNFQIQVGRLCGYLPQRHPFRSICRPWLPSGCKDGRTPPTTILSKT